MKRLSLLALWISASFCPALDKMDIELLASKPHDRKGISKELSLYPEAREYAVSVRSKEPGGEFGEWTRFTIEERTVEGRYIVSRGGPAEDFVFTLVVEWDGEGEVYRKWVLLPDGNVVESIGIALPGGREISWVSKPDADNGIPLALGIEKHGDEESSWREVIFREGDPVMILEGRAVKTK